MPLWKKRDGERSDHEDDDRRNGSEPPIIKKTAKETHGIRWHVREIVLTFNDGNVQGDPSGCSLGFVDIKTKVEFSYKDHILKRYLCFDVNKT